MKKLILISIFLMGCSTEPEDCGGVTGGDALIDDCGACTGGNTGLVTNYLKDCEGVCDGAVMEDCEGICGGDTIEDCLEICDGDAIEDDCGVCNGNNINMDCNGECFGSAMLDACGNCTSNAYTMFPICEGYKWDYNVEVNHSSFAIGQGTQTSTEYGEITMIVDSFSSSTGVAKFVISGDLNYNELYEPLNNEIYIRQSNGLLERSDNSTGPWNTALNTESSSWTNGGLLFAGNPSYTFYLSTTTVNVPAGSFSGYLSEASEDNWGEPYTSDSHDYVYQEVFVPELGMVYSRRYSYYNDTTTWEYGPYITELKITLKEFGMVDPLQCANTFTENSPVDIDGDGTIDSCWYDDYYYEYSSYFSFNWEGGCLATELSYSGGTLDISLLDFTSGFYWYNWGNSTSETFTIYFENGTSSTLTATSTDCGTTGRQKVVPDDIFLLGN